jgi:hypothetical protein
MLSLNLPSKGIATTKFCEMQSHLSASCMRVLESKVELMRATNGHAAVRFGRKHTLPCRGNGLAGSHGRGAAAELLSRDEAAAHPRDRGARRNWSRRRLARMRIDSPKHPNQAYAETSPAAAMPQASVAERPVVLPP